eukprot:Selendium_serpulae@DN9774_c0_g1_i1.p1
MILSVVDPQSHWSFRGRVKDSFRGAAFIKAIADQLDIDHGRAETFCDQLFDREVVSSTRSRGGTAPSKDSSGLFRLHYHTNPMVLNEVVRWAPNPMQMFNAPQVIAHLSGLMADLKWRHR